MKGVLGPHGSSTSGSGEGSRMLLLAELTADPMSYCLYKYLKAHLAHDALQYFLFNIVELFYHSEL